MRQNVQTKFRKIPNWKEITKVIKCLFLEDCGKEGVFSQDDKMINRPK